MALWFQEHFEKLKFNYLEMSTKQNFMQRLLDPDEWNHLYNNTIWTPADVKSLEKQMEPTKIELVEAKRKTSELEGDLGKITEHLCNCIFFILLFFVFFIFSFISKRDCGPKDDNCFGIIS